MSCQIIINANPQESRVALMENARLCEIFIERTRERGIAGSIYNGRIARVLPGMQAAFVDIGLPKAAFLHASECIPGGLDTCLLDHDLDDAEFFVSPRRPTAAAYDGPFRSTEPPPITQLVKKGQEVLVQIAKEPMGTKGARLTCNISTPGRYLVYLPLSHHTGISRRITDEQERERLRTAVDTFGTAGGGIIIRTAAEGVSKREIQADLRTLRRLWAQIMRRRDSLPTPSPLHADLDIVLRTIRDLSTRDVSRILVDNRRHYQRIVDFIAAVMPRLRASVELYDSAEPIFERYGIESQIAKALERKVWLKSGGHIVIDHTEALTAIDVNTGRYVGATNQKDTILQTNLEAAQAIVHQLRVRNIGGLIIIDFIDMDDAEHRRSVLAEFNAALRADKAKTTILGISELGLVEMTRKRTRESLGQRLCEPCPTCGGDARVKSVAATAYDVLRRIRREAKMNAPLQQVTVTLHPLVAAFLDEQEPAAIREIEHEFEVKIVMRKSREHRPDQYAVVAQLSESDTPLNMTTRT